ncbi:MAG: NAD(P)H-binding protein, partial [Pleurocapsa sp. SU_196_0]|nr:NAD(P)H-binding protein [Pleurocapsa sp. SU_196_0]
MKTVLVTGATGFIGSHLVETLLERGFAVRTLVRPGSKPKNAVRSHPHLEPFAAPLTVAGVTAAAEGCATVYHVAGSLEPAATRSFLWANAEGTRVA